MPTLTLNFEDLTMTYTYTWANAEQTLLNRDDGASIPTDPANRNYAEFLASNETAADYVAPPAPPALTTEQKLNAAGLTVAELKELFGLT
jgi:hypothetical protein